ncbi:sigma-54-dependent transcriptional regulator [Thermodesulforhabdus norvegica]|uniref:Two component, sigma54 specific, transcriptional regulator, Fis family n=1 Tax=Thermodesulforhabdus norvegica TaxID=39841 RepID=A0A1I4UMW7_9BACT|nr:sigma-54 dependent transcriptional regulator [Thermodesulforhabdus norvegica]SFM90278.1 two component, sigma54 specific, transcriptional regulator, Fis family [Thermodesulforhabdus norvegica]
MKVLVVDDDPGMLEFLGLMLKKRGHEVVTTTDAIKALEMVRSGEKFDVVIADIRMKPVDGLAVLIEVKKHSPETSVVMISAYANEETALQAMNEGAYDYLPKPFQLDELYRILDELAGLKDSEEGEIQCGRYHLHFGLFIGESPAMHRVYDAIRKVALVDSTVLISGESGTGKELVAKAIHRLSRRSKGPFVVVNCGGVPESLIESELFGYKKGAFTGATSDRKGLVEAAHGGTLFLDEIGELTPALQVKLLRLIQEKSIRRIGDTCDIPVDVRIIAATNRDLEQMVLEGSFREDLYYRLNVIPIRLPPLRERREDIPLLAHYFMEKYSSLLGKDVRRISSYALDILRRYDFPGNVRELENIIERGVALEQSRIILPESLTIASGLMMRKKRVESPAPLFGEIPPEGLNLDELLEKVERHYLIEALKQTQGHKQRAAELLGMTFRSFRYRLAKYRIEVPEEDTRETGR